MTEREEYLQSVLEGRLGAANKNVERHVTNANETERALCGQLMLINTVLLTLSAATLGGDFIKEPFTFAQSVLIITGITSLVVSIASGVLFYLKIIKSEIEWAVVEHKQANIFSGVTELTDQAITNAEAKAKRLRSTGLNTSNMFPLHLEIATLGLALLVFGGLIVSLLFNFNGLITF